MRRRWSILAVLMCLVISVTGCKTNEDKEEGGANLGPGKEEKAHQGNLDMIQPSAYRNVNGLKLEAGTNISIIGRGKSSAYWSEVRKGAEAAVDEINEMLGYKGEDKIKLTYSAPAAEDDVDDQVNILDEELARYPAAVGIAAVDAAACEVQFDLAVENGIPVVAFDSGTTYQNIVSMVDTNNPEAAAMAASKLSASIGDEGEVLIVAHDTKSTSAVQRESAFVNALKEKYPNVTVAVSYHLDELEEMKKTMTEGQKPSSEETEQGEEAAPEGTQEEMPETEDEEIDISQEDVIRYLLQQHPNVKAIYTTNETGAKLVVGVLEELEKSDVKVVSFDGGEDQLKLLEEGKLEGLIVQNPYGIGYATVIACARAVLEQGNEAQVDTGYTWVTADNMKDQVIERVMY
ncbi:substrate-binding domain-containing protein [Roseburia hominis]